MSDFTVYPAIDLRGGQVVRLKEGDPTRQTAYSDDPAETARRWLTFGARWLHVINLDGALRPRPAALYRGGRAQGSAFGESDTANQRALRAILEMAREFDARVQLGGGLRSLDAIEAILELGVDRAIIGTLAVEQPEVLEEALARFDPERIAVGIDARDGRVRVRGWQADSGIAAPDLALRMRPLGLRTVIFTDVSRDGMGRGLNIAATKALAEASGLGVIASGGVHTLDDVVAARDAGLAGVIVGRALYEGTVDLKEALNPPRPDPLSTGKDGTSFEGRN